MGYENMAKKDKAQEKEKGNAKEQEKKAKREITEATPEVLEKILAHKFKKGFLKLVVGKQTGVPAIIYRDTFNKDTHTGFLRDAKGKKIGPLTPKVFIKIAHEKGYAVATDQKYVRLWSSRYYKDTTGNKTAAVDHKRKGMTFEEMREAASKMELKNYTKKGSKSSLAASLRRALKKKAKQKAKKIREEPPVEVKSSKKPKEAPAEKEAHKKAKEKAPVEKEVSKQPKKEAPAEKKSIPKPKGKFERLKNAAKIEIEASEDTRE